jgi:hypothetical protein
MAAKRTLLVKRAGRPKWQIFPGTDMTDQTATIPVDAIAANMLARE